MIDGMTEKKAFELLCENKQLKGLFFLSVYIFLDGLRL